MRPPVEVRAVAGRSDLDRFIRFPWQIYRNDPNWVAPLIVEVRKALDRQAHPFHQHADVQYFLAWRGRDVVGRIAACVNHLYNEFHADTTGFFGLFESLDDEEAAAALLLTAERWLRERGRTSALGPMNFSTNEEISSPGVLVDGHDTPPKFMMAHTPPYYARLLDRAGYLKAKDLLSYWMDAEQTPDRLKRAFERMQRSEGLVIRSLNLRDFANEIERMKRIYNQAWERNWGFVPMTDAEFDHMARAMRPIVDPDMVLIAEVNGEPIGFAIQLPDYNEALRHVNGRLLPFGVFKFLWYKRSIRTVRVLTLGVVPEHRGKGFDAMLVARLFEVTQPKNMARGECSWILEDNLPMRNAMDRLNAFVYKTYRVFEKKL